MDRCVSCLFFVLLVGAAGCAQEDGPRVVNGCTIVPGTSCRGARLNGEDLVASELAGADLNGAVLQGTNLSFANLDGADLSNTNLAQANLTGASLVGANLFKANLIDANFTGADITDVDWSSATCPDGASGNEPTGCVDHLR